MGFFDVPGRNIVCQPREKEGDHSVPLISRLKLKCIKGRNPNSGDGLLIHASDHA